MLHTTVNEFHGSAFTAAKNDWENIFSTFDLALGAARCAQRRS